MRRLVCTLALLPLGLGPALAADLPAALSERLQQGVQACINYYADDTPITTLIQKGFKTKGSDAQIVLAPPTVKRKITVTTLVEGPRKGECEVHANFTRSETRKHAFHLTLATFTKNGFGRLKERPYTSRAKTIYTRGPLSMFHKIDMKQGKVMIKFLVRSK